MRAVVAVGSRARLALLVLLLPIDLYATVTFERTYGGVVADYGFSVQQTTDGGYIIAGMTYSFGAGNYDVYLIKTNAQGDTLWTRTYGGPHFDEGYSVQQTTDGGYIIAGYTYSFGAGTPDSNNVYLVKTNAQGDTLWTRNYNESGGRCVRQTADGGFIVTGYAADSAGNYDVCLIKTDSLGNVAVAEPKTSLARATTFSLTCEPNPCRGQTEISLKPQAPSPRRCGCMIVKAA